MNRGFGIKALRDTMNRERSWLRELPEDDSIRVARIRDLEFLGQNTRNVTCSMQDSEYFYPVGNLSVKDDELAEARDGKVSQIRVERVIWGIAGSEAWHAR